jgi:hypothetical protein
VFLHVVLVTFKADVARAEVDAWTSEMATTLAKAPFRLRASADSAPLGILPSAADWGYIAEVATEEDLKSWEQDEGHLNAARKLAPLRAMVMNIQLPAE